MPILVAPPAGILADRIGSRPPVATGVVLMATGLAWIAEVASPTVPYSTLVVPFAITGVGMSLFIAPIYNDVLAAVPHAEEGTASGVNNTLRELGGVFGVAVLASVFSAAGGYATPTAFVEGMTAAVWVGVAVLGAAALAALALPGHRRSIPEHPEQTTTTALGGATTEPTA